MNTDNRETVIQIVSMPTLPSLITLGPDTDILPYKSKEDFGEVILSSQKISKIKIKSLLSNAFIIVVYDDILYAVGTIPQQGETFRIVPINNYQVKLRMIGGQFVRIDYNGTLLADANKNNATIFNIYRTGYMEFSLIAAQVKYVNVRQRDNLTVDRKEYGNFETRSKFRKVN